MPVTLSTDENTPHTNKAPCIACRLKDGTGRGEYDLNSYGQGE